MQPLSFYASRLKEFSLHNMAGIGDVDFSLGDELQRSMQIVANTLFSSDFFTINDLVCYCREPSVTSKTDCNSNFNITFTREGYFLFNSYPKAIDAHISNIFLKKPGCDYSVTQMTDSYFGCTIINFSEKFIDALGDKYDLKHIDFFKNPDIYTLAITSTPQLTLLHYLICQHLSLPENSKLYLDCVIIEVVEEIMEILSAGNPIASVSPACIKHQVPCIQRAKEYMASHFCQSINLRELARNCYVSPFHFSRIFRSFTGYSPYHYLQMLRLKNAEILLKISNLSITDVAFKSGFNSLDYFCAAFTKIYGMPPSKYKKVLG